MYTKVIDGKQVFSNCKTIQNNDGCWVSNPTPEMIAEAGWVEYTPPTPEAPDPNEIRKQEILDELKSMDYLTSKYIDGEDMSQYGEWQQLRKTLREEYRRLNGEVAYEEPAE